MSQLTYNGISLDDIKTQRIEQEVIYDASGVDYLFTKINITVHCIFNTALMPAQGGETPAAIMKRVRKCLLMERQVLNYSTEAQYIVSPSAGSEDAFHGPLPQYCHVVEVQGTQCFLVEYSVTTWIVECCEGQSLAYMSNRWKEHHTIDKYGYTKRQINGMVRFKGGGTIDTKTFGQKGMSADDFARGMIIPPTLSIPGNANSAFRRETQDYEVSEDGLTWTYNIVDQEYYTNPPIGLMDISGQHTVECNKGAIYKEHITVTGTGNPVTTKKTLLAACMAVLFGRLNLNGNFNKKFVIAGYTRDQIHENVVEVSASTQIQLLAKTADGLNLPASLAKCNYILGSKFGLNPPPVGDRGTANLHFQSFNTYLQRCTTFSSSLAPAGASSANITGVPNNPQGAAVNAEPPSEPTKVIQGQTGVYTNFQMESEYHTDQQTIHMPLMTSNSTLSALANLAQPTMKKVVKWTAERWGAIPKVPDEDSSDPNLVLLHSRVKPVNVDIGGDGTTLVYTIHGTYTYAVKNSAAVAIAAGTAPYLTIAYGQTMIPDSSFVTGLDDPGNSLGSMS